MKKSTLLPKKPSKAKKKKFDCAERKDIWLKRMNIEQILENFKDLEPVTEGFEEIDFVNYKHYPKE